MTSVTIGGRDYILRPDLNALGEIWETVGDLSREAPGIKGTLVVTAILINEHFAVTGENERVTPEQLGRQTDVNDLRRIRDAVAAAIRQGLGDEKNA